MLGNVKTIELEDGKIIDLSNIVGDFIKVPEGDHFSMIHIRRFFDKHVKVDGLYDLLMEKEEAFKLSQRALKAAETRRKNRKKAKAETNASEEMSVGMSVGMSGVFKKDLEKHEEAHADTVGSTIIEPEEVKEVEETKDEEIAVPKEAFAPSDEEMDNAQESLKSITESVKNEQEEIAVELKIPTFENDVVNALAVVIDKAGFANCAEKGNLLIAASNQFDFDSKMAAYSNANDVVSLPVYSGDVSSFETIDLNKFMSKDDLDFKYNTSLLCGPSSTQFEVALRNIERMNKGDKFFFAFHLSPEGGLKNLPHFEEFQTIVKSEVVERKNYIEGNVGLSFITKK